MFSNKVRNERRSRFLSLEFDRGVGGGRGRRVGRSLARSSLGFLEGVIWDFLEGYWDYILVFCCEIGFFFWKLGFEFVGVEGRVFSVWVVFLYFKGV